MRARHPLQLFSAIGFVVVFTIWMGHIMKNRETPQWNPLYNNDFLCITTLPPNLRDQDGDMPIKIPDSLNLPEQVIACMFHRYVTTIQTTCVEPKLFGISDKNGGFVCIDNNLIRKESCNAAIFGDAVDIHYIYQLQAQYNCNISTFVEEEESYDFKTSLETWLSTQKVEYGIINLLVLTLRNEDVKTMQVLLENAWIMERIMQLTIKIYYPPNDASPTGYKERLVMFRSIYKLGFRIFFFDRDWACVPPNTMEYQFLSCYSVYMIRPQTLLPPLVTLPSEKKLSSSLVALRAYDKFLSSLHIMCQQNLRLGKIKDGGWNVCHDRKYRPEVPCIVYSFGINNDWSFDESMSTVYGCNVFSFDPSMGIGTHKHSEKVWFYNVGISKTDYINSRNWDLRTLSSIVEMLNHTGKKIDILKMDVEGSEWQSLSNMLDSGILNKVGQLYLEFHSGMSVDRLMVLKRLFDNNFRIFWTHRNPISTNIISLDGGVTSFGFEVYFINTKFY